MPPLNDVVPGLVMGAGIVVSVWYLLLPVLVYWRCGSVLRRLRLIEEELQRAALRQEALRREALERETIRRATVY